MVLTCLDNGELGKKEKRLLIDRSEENDPLLSEKNILAFDVSDLFR